MESWRIKRYYPPRVLISVADLLNPPLSGSFLVCLSGAELVILRNLMAYCQRRSTFVSSFQKGYYLVPDAADWDVVEAIVAELEHKLMTTCEDLVAQLEALVTALSAQGESVCGLVDAVASGQETLDAMAGSLSDASAALQCVCASMPLIADGATTSRIVDEYLGDEGLAVDDPYPLQETPGEYAEACAVAQLVWSSAFEMLTEVVQPAQQKAVSVLLPMAMAVLASWIGTPAILIPVGPVLALLWSIIEVWVAGELTNVENALYAGREDLICAMFRELKGSGSLADASSAAVAEIDGWEDISPLDKMVLGSLVAPWVISRMALAYENETAWAQARVTPGYCSVCVEGADWWAEPYEGPTSMPIHLEHFGGTPEWVKGCFLYNLPVEQMYVGVAFRVTGKSGNQVLKRMKATGSCDGVSYTMWPNTSDELQNGSYVSISMYWLADPQGVVNKLYPGGTLLTVPHEYYGWAPTDPMAFGGNVELGYYGDGEAYVTIEWLIYKKV